MRRPWYTAFLVLIDIGGISAVCSFTNNVFIVAVVAWIAGATTVSLVKSE